MNAAGGAPVPVDIVARLPAARPFIAPEELQRRYGHAELLRLGANESAFGPPPAAIEAMRAALPRAAWYGDPESVDLREALARKHGVAPDNIVVGAGIDDLHALAVRAYAGPGDVAVAAEGTYPTFAYHVAGNGATLATVPYNEDGTIPLGALAALARERSARIAFLANPDNPSGSAVSDERVRTFARELPPATLLVLDEAYAEFGEGVGMDERIDPQILRTRTFSKAYGLAGARIGYAVASLEICAALNKIRLQYGVNRTAQIGALAALGAQAFVADVVAQTRAGRAEYAALGERLGMATLPSSTNFVLFDAGSRQRAEELMQALIERGVFVRKPGAPPLDRAIRVTVGTAPERARFAEILATVAASVLHA